MAVTTLAQRKENEATRRRLASRRLIGDLAAYASANGGRFVVFGSYVEERMTHESDLDVLVDFPSCTSAAAWTFAEVRADAERMPIDLHDAAVSKAAFVDRVRARGISLP